MREKGREGGKINKRKIKMVKKKRKEGGPLWHYILFVVCVCV
jgi:hypothetical protein